MSELVGLLNQKKITQFEYKSYLLFQVNDDGREYLKQVCEMYWLEEPANLERETTFAWKDGRLSVWRDIKLAIAQVEDMLINTQEDKEDERRTDDNGNWSGYE